MTPMPQTYESPESLLEAVRPMHEAGYYWALRLASGDTEVASDALQACYLKILEGRARYSGTSSLKTWFFSVLRYTILEDIRPGLRFVPASAEQESDENSQDIELEILESNTLLSQLFKRLSTRQQEIVSLVFYHRITIEEAAGVMGISLGSARTHYERAKSNLKLLIERHGLLKELHHG